MGSGACAIDLLHLAPPSGDFFFLTNDSCSYIHGTTERKIMTEEEFLTLINLFEFVQQISHKHNKPFSFGKDLETVRELIKRQGDLYVKV